MAGNLSFLNWLTIVPSLAFFDDKFLCKIFTSSTNVNVYQLQKLEKTTPDAVSEG